MNPDRLAFSDTISHHLRVVSDLHTRVSDLTQKMSLDDLSELDDALEDGGSRRPLRALLAVFAQTLPIPAWIKNKDGVIVWSNLKYREKYGDNIHLADGEFWDQVTAAGFDANDQLAMNQQEVVWAVEDVAGEKLLVAKWGLFLGNEAAECCFGIGPVNL